MAAPAGIYATDAAADANVAVIGTFPEDGYPPIISPVALTGMTTAPDTAASLARVRLGKARPSVEAQGFTVLGERRS